MAEDKKVIGKPFPKGQSGNPAGRPPGVFSLTEEMKKYLTEQERDDDGKPTGRTNARAFIELVVEKAAEGNPEALKQVINRLEGPVPSESKIDVTSAGQAIKQWIVIPPEPDAE